MRRLGQALDLLIWLWLGLYIVLEVRERLGWS